MEGKEREIQRIKKELEKCLNFIQVLANDEGKHEKQFKQESKVDYKCKLLKAKYL